VATLSVEGLNKSAIARVARIGWNTVDRWLEKATDCGRRFNDQELTGFKATELRADEIRTIIQGKQQPTWIFAAIEVWSRLWSSTVSADAATKARWPCFGTLLNERTRKIFPLIATTDLSSMKKSSGRSLGQPVSLARSNKTRRNNRMKVERREVIRAERRFEERLQRSEDSSTLTHRLSNA